MATVIIVTRSQSLVEDLTKGVRKTRPTTNVIGLRNPLLIKNLVRRVHPELVVLDVASSASETLRLVDEMRAEGAGKGTLSVLVMADAAEAIRLAHDETRVDDVLMHPLDLWILLARIEALLSRHDLPANGGSDMIRWKELTVDLYRHKAMCRKRELALTLTEFRLLQLLIRAEGEVVPRSNLIDELYGVDAMVLEGTINSNVRKLRHKLGEDGDLIVTVRGIGYRLCGGS